MRRITLLGGVICAVASIAVVGSALADGGSSDQASSGKGTLALRAQRAGEPFTVKIKVIEGKGETLALIPVTAHGKKLVFIVDTGASRSQLNTKVAASLGLEKVGKPQTVSGVGCTSKTQPVRIDDWSIAGHDLPSRSAPRRTSRSPKAARSPGCWAPTCGRSSARSRSTTRTKR